MRLLLLLLPTLLSAQTTNDLCAPPPGSVPPTLPAKLLDGQGQIHFPITTSNPQAQAFFDQGVAQMHSFWAREAERSFLQAGALDPDAPMPYWGIAMVAAGDYRPGFQLDLVNGREKRWKKPKEVKGGLKRAVDAARKAQELSGRATDLEKMYIQSVASLRDLGRKDPNLGYVAGLRAIVAKYPHEVEAKSYLALHLMSGFERPDKKPRPGSMEAVALLKELLVEATDHPGVHHYVIHGYEGSTFAKDAWPSCERYPQLSSNIPHALHMPGHIWAQTGRWKEAEKSFADAAANERDYMKADSLYGNGHHGHNVHFLIATYAFEGKYDDAMGVARELLAIKETPREAKQVDNWYSAHRQGWFGMMRTLVYCERWDQILDGKTLPVYNQPREQAWRHWSMGLAYVAKGDFVHAKAEAGEMDKALKDWKAKTKEKLVDTLAVAREELKGQIALGAKNVDKALASLEKASMRERAIHYSEPPPYPRPIAEVVGQIALKNGERERAEAAFRTALEQYPGSMRAVAGLRAAAKSEAPAVAGQ